VPVDACAALHPHLPKTAQAELCGFKLKRIKCGMEGLVEEAMSLVDQIGAGPILDAALIGSAQKAEHYEIACYTSLCLLAEKRGFADAAPLLLQATVIP